MSTTQKPRLIEVKLQTLPQLFNSMDPSPFHERDLDHNAEQFILSWAQEYPIRVPLKLVVHLGQKPEGADPERLVAESVHHYFAYRYELNLREFSLLLREGWTSLLIGLMFLAVCVTIAQTMSSQLGRWQVLTREGLTIIGWVAMWRPLDTYLYRWWPLRHLGKIFRKLSQVPVEVRAPAA
jgi:hypothetical protein